MTKVLLILAVSLALLGCKPEKVTVADACSYLRQYLVIAKVTDHPETKRASRVQIEHYKRYCRG